MEDSSAVQMDVVAPRYDILIFSKTAGYRHASIPDGIDAVRRLGREHGFSVDATEDSGILLSDSLSKYETLVFLNTSGDFLNDAEQAAFEAFVRSGGGFVGIHGAAAGEYEWPFYGELVGAWFDEHPKPQQASVRVLDRVHPSTAHLPARWVRYDEWYNYRSNPRGTVHVLMTLDERTYKGGGMGHDHPIAWAHEYEGGRAWYTGLGHTSESYSDPLFLQHILGGIEWAAGQKEADVHATLNGSFRKVVLVGPEEITDPLELDVAPDGRVFFVEREGAVKLWDPATKRVKQVGFVPSWATGNEGMMGLALDPNFSENGWLYVFHSPPGPENTNDVVRFTVVGDELDPASKKVILQVPTERQFPFHSGGGLAFGPDGSLYIGTGDNTSPHDSDGFAPIDERPGRRGFDAQRTSANTNDLRGKVLRIKPLPDGTYAIPDGNLFPGGEGGRPEIYAMGTRNAYRLAVDQETGWLYWGDVGPDAGAANEERGPESYDELNQAREAGNFGWPLFVGDNQAYRDWNFETETAGASFDPNAPINDSPHNTGSQQLPPARPALIWYPYGPSEQFPELGSGGRVAMAGPIYRYDAETVGPTGLPAYYDGSVFFYEWARGWLKEVKLDDQGRVLQINPFLADVEFRRPMDLELGPDGSLYLIEWGTDYEGYNRDAQIVRLEYVGAGNAVDRVATAGEAGSDTESIGALLTISWPVHGGFFEFGEPVPFEVEATGVGEFRNEEVAVQPYQGFNTHTTPLPALQGMSGTVRIPADDSQQPYVVNRFAVLELAYDGEASKEDPVTQDRIILQPKRKQAEHATSVKGAQREVEGSTRNKGQDVPIYMVVQSGGYLSYAPVNLVNIERLAFRVAPRQSGVIEVRLDAPDGQLLGQVDVAGTTTKPVDEGQRAEDAWETLHLPIQDPGGAHELFVVVQGSGDEPILKLDWIEFEGAGVSGEVSHGSR